jgi:Arc/MetJ family transcription regulator
MARTRTAVQIDTRLVDEAATILGAKSRTEAVRVALRIGLEGNSKPRSLSRKCDYSAKRREARSN